VALCTNVFAKDQVIDWSFGSLPDNYQVDLLQCQSLVFTWSNDGGQSASAQHDVWEYDDEDAFARCDFGRARPLIGSSPAASGQFTMSDDDTLEVTKRWFGSSVGSDCIDGNMRLAVKIRPHFVQKYERSKCVGGTVDVQKREDSLKMCRKRCKRRRGCIAIEYNAAAQKNCILFSSAPTSFVPSPSAQCEVAATDCDGLAGEEEDNPSPTVPPPTNPPSTYTDDDASGDDPAEPTLLVPEQIIFKPTPDFVDELVGFAAVSSYGRSSTTGGQGGKIVRVSNREDFVKVIKDREPRIVLVDGMIDLLDPACPCKTTFTVRSDKTILGIGRGSGISGGGLSVRGVKFERPPDYDPSDSCICESREDEDEPRYPSDVTELPVDATPTNNVIIRNLIFDSCAEDCISVEKFAHHVWIDHNDFSGPGDGAIDIKKGSDLVTVSWNKFSNTDKTMLCGHNDDNRRQDLGRLRVTYHHNYFRETKQRNPRVRIAEPVHVYNNHYQRNEGYGVGSAINAGVVIEANYFEDVVDPIRNDLDPDGIPGRIVERWNVYTRSGSPPLSDNTVAEPGMYYRYKMHLASEIPALVEEWGGTGVVY